MTMSRALKGGIFKAVLLFSLLVGFLMLVVLLVDVFKDGLPYLDWTLLTNPPSSDPEIAGARPAIIATLYIGILLLLFVVNMWFALVGFMVMLGSGLLVYQYLKRMGRDQLRSYGEHGGHFSITAALARLAERLRRPRGTG